MIEKKLILYAIIGLALGMATIVPAEYFMGGQTQVNAQTPEKPWFNVNVPYAYYSANATSSQDRVAYGESFYIALNITTYPDAIKTPLPDDRLEYYYIQVYSDQGSIENFTYVISTAILNSVDVYTSWNYAFANYFNAGDIAYGNISDLSLPTKEWIFLQNFNGTLPTTTKQSWPLGPTYTLTSENQAISGVSSSISNGLLIQGINMTSTNVYVDHELQRISNIQNAQKISIDISRIGYVTMEGNSTIVTSADTGVIQHIELTPYQGGFLYNTAIPQDQLSQTNLESPTFP